MNNKYIIALALMLGVVFTGQVSAQLTTMGMTEKAKTEAVKPADEAATKPAEDANKAVVKEDEKASTDKDAKKDMKKEGAVQTCGQASSEEEEGE